MTRNDKNKILAIELRKWLSQSHFKNIAEFAKHLEIKKSTMGDYFLGRAFPGEQNLRKILETTGINTLDADLQTSSDVKQISTGKITSAEAEKVYELLTKLRNSLEYFKKGLPKDREIFRRKIPKTDIGYLITLLKALFDEDEFQNWIFFAEYKGGTGIHKGGAKS